MVRWRTAGLLVVAIALGFVAWLRFPPDLWPRLWPHPTTHRGHKPAPPPPVSDPARLSRAQFPGHVADGARMLPLFSHTLEHMAQSWSDDLGIDFEVVTVSDPDHSVEVLAPKVFQIRHIGGDSPVGGILVLLNPVRGEARIEVSYALEGAFPDALVGRITHDQLAPYASYRLAGMAVMDVIHQLKDWAWLQSVRGAIALPDSYKTRKPFRSHMRFLSGGAGAQVRLADIPVDRDLKAPVPAAQRARYAPSSDPLKSAEAFQRVLQDLAGDPSLELFTEGSRIMRASYPMAPFESLERALRLEDSKPLRVITHGDRAVVTSDHPVHGFVPVLLFRQGGLWRVDLVETWKNLFFDWDGNYHLANSNTPYFFGLSAFGNPGPADVAAFSGLDGDVLPAVLARLKKTPGPAADFVRGEILFRNCFVFVEAVHAYEQAVEKAPQDTLFLNTLADRALYVGFPELAVQTYRKMRPQPHLAISRALVQAQDLPGAEAEARKAVDRNPYDTEALRQLESTLRRQKRDGEAAEIATKLRSLTKDSDREWAPVTLAFDPPAPVLYTKSPVMSGGRAVYDHSTFSVTMTNPSARSVVIDQVRLISVGTGHPSGLGEIRDYWKYPSGGHVLEPGESVSFSKLWGYVVDTRQQQVSYIFDYCWHGRPFGKRQCRNERIDTFAR